MFLGEYKLQFTGAGRVVLPSRFRETLKEDPRVVLSRGLDGCIWGFEISNWQKEMSKYLEMPITDQQARDFRRYLFSAAEIVKLDNQGRFVIPRHLLEYAQIHQTPAIIGAGDHFEIWNGQVWDKLKDTFQR